MLKAFLARFNKPTVQVDEPDEKLFVVAFLNGLNFRTFIKALVIRKPTSVDEVQTRDEAHIKVEEATTSKKYKDIKRVTYTPLNAKLSYVLKEVLAEKLLKLPEPVAGGMFGTNSDAFVDIIKRVGTPLRIVGP